MEEDQNPDLYRANSAQSFYLSNSDSHDTGIDSSTRSSSPTAGIDSRSRSSSPTSSTINALTFKPSTLADKIKVSPLSM